MVTTWELKGLLYHDFGAYVYATVVLGAFGLPPWPSKSVNIPGLHSCLSPRMELGKAESLAPVFSHEHMHMRGFEGWQGPHRTRYRHMKDASNALATKGVWPSNKTLAACDLGSLAVASPNAFSWNCLSL